MMLPVAFSVPHVKKWIIGFLGGMSVFFAYLGAQAGLLPYAGGWPVIYALKVFVTSFGMPGLFSDVLPSVFGIDTLHAYVSLSDVRFAELFVPSERPLLMSLVSGQLLFLVVFVVIIGGIALMGQRMLRPVERTEVR